MSRDHKPECGWYWDGRACICETQAEKSMFKRRMTRPEFALFLLTDGMQSHDIQGETGLPEEDCEKVWKEIQKVREMYMPSGAADPADWKNS